MDMSDYILSCESTADIPYDYCESRGIPIIFYGYEIDGKIYEDNMERNPKQTEEFYAAIAARKLPSTSQINQFAYEEFFDELLEKGDVIHLVMGTGFSASYQNALNAAEEVEEKHPDRKLYVVNSLCGCSGLGLFLDDAADRRDEGMSIDELFRWCEDHKLNYHHEFFNSDLMYFMRTGRLSGSTAVIGNMLNIVPSMHLNAESKLIAYGKERGRKKAIRHMLNEMIDHAENGTAYTGKCFVSGADCSEDAAYLAGLVKETFPSCSIRICNIGTIIASHCGPGTLSMYYYGDPRT